jgi:hypothetical protein
MSKKQKAVSAKIQDIALYGIKKEKLVPAKYGDWFHLLLYLAWHGWNVSIQGEEDGLSPRFEEEVAEIKAQLKISRREIEENFVSSDLRKVVSIMAEVKAERYPNDRRIILALEFTEQGTLKAYTTG